MPRRTVHFATFDDALRDAESLRAGGYERVGSWNLGQVCHHLAVVIEMSLDGFPMRSLPWPVRLLARGFLLGRVLRRDVFRRTIPAPSAILPPETDDRAGLDRLRAVIGRFESWAGPIQPSPVFGPLSHDEWRELHLWHCEHHLSFLIPQPETGTIIPTSEPARPA